jgi:hypothetical protein
MAELEYFGTWADSSQILKDLLGSGEIRVLIDRAYPSPVPEFFHFPDDHLVSAARRVSKMYLFGPFSLAGPLFWRQESGPKSGSFYVYENRGGPALGLSLANETTSGLLGWGLFYYRSEYLNPVTGSWDKPSNSLKNAYGAFSRAIRRHLRRVRFPKGSAWVGKDGLARLKSGELRLNAAGLV